MNRQQKRYNVRTLAKEIKGAREGRLTTSQLKAAHERMKRLEDAGVIKRNRRPRWRWLKSIGKMLGVI